MDRRKLEEKLKQLIETDLKDQNKETPAPTTSGSVILRKKSDVNKESTDKDR